MAANRSNDRNILTEARGTWHRERAQLFGKGAGIEICEMAEDQPAIGEVVDQSVGHVSVLDAEPPAKRHDFVGEQLRCRRLAEQRRRGFAILLARAWLAGAGNDEPVDPLRELFEIVDARSVPSTPAIPFPACA